MIVTHDGYEKRYVLSPRREEIGKSLARNSVRTFAKHAFVNKMTRKELLARVRFNCAGRYEKDSFRHYIEI